MEQHQNQPQTQQPAQTTQPNKKASKGKKLWLISGVVVAVVVMVGIVAYFAAKQVSKNPPKGIYANLDGQIATQAEFDEINNAYLKFAQQNNKENSDPKQVEKKAADEVLLRLSFQAEQAKRGRQLCDQKQVDEILTKQYSSAGGREAFYNNLNRLYGWTEAVTLHKTCLEYYETALKKELITGFNLTGVYIRWDIGLGQDQKVREELETKAKARLENEYVPLLKSGASNDEISSKVDINKDTSAEEFTDKTTSLTNPASRTQFFDSLNAVQYAGFQQYEEGEDEMKYIDKLNAGDLTPVFKSKTGYYIVYRANSLNNAPYKSFQEMVDQYIKKGKVSNSYFNLPPPKEGDVLSFTGQEKKNSPIDSLRELFVPTANAAIYCFTASVAIHEIPTTIEYQDAATGSRIGGGSFDIQSMTDVQGACEDAETGRAGLGGYFDSLGRLNANGIGVSGGEKTVSLSCYTAWAFKFNAPSGYKALTASDYATSTGIEVYRDGVKVDSTNRNASSTAYPGTFSISTSVWNAVGANGADNFRIVVKFTQDRIPAGTIYTSKYSPSTHGANGVFTDVNSDINSNQAKMSITNKNDNTFVRSTDADQDFAYQHNGWNKGDIWVSDNSYRVSVDVPEKFKLVKTTIEGANANASPAVSCSETGGRGTCTVSGVNVSDLQITYVNFFFEPRVRGSFDGVCANSGGPKGKAWGWVIDYFYEQVSNDAAKTPSELHIYISNSDGTNRKGYSGIIANKDRPDLPSATSDPSVGRYHGFEFDVPLEYYDGRDYIMQVYPVRGGQGFGEQLGNDKTFNCGTARGDVYCERRPDGTNWLVGWGFDPRRPAEPPEIHVYFDSTPNATSDPDAVYNNGNIRGTKPWKPPFPSYVAVNPTNAVDYLRSEGYPNVVTDGNYGWEFAIPDGLHDGEEHTARAYIITKDSPGEGVPNYQLIPPEKAGGATNAKNIVFGPNTGCDKVEKWWWPWLQTQNGDVINNGKITGQNIAQNATDLPGARLKTDQSKEAEFLVISMTGGGNPFCSNYNYILTNTTATTGDCKNGGGYGTLQLYDLDSGGQDKVFKAITDAYAANGAGNPPGNTQCKPYNTVATGVPTTLSTSCEGGTIYQFGGGDSLGSIKLGLGRNTIFKDGDLKLTGNIAVPSDAYSTPNPKLQPNLAIIVNGNVYIDKSVTRLDAAIYATGKIFTCSSGSPTPFNQCNQQLVVNGMLASRKGYDFRRTFANTGRQPAELIRLKGQTVVFPPPGLDNLYFEDFNNDLRIDTSEFQPKF